MLDRIANIFRLGIFALLCIGLALSVVACTTLPEFTTPQPQQSADDTSHDTDTDTDASQDTAEHTVSTHIVRVIDGDTVAVPPSQDLPATNAAGTEHSVRVLGIDTPEMDWDTDQHECGAAPATDYVAELLPEGTDITLVYDPVADTFDRYDRSLAYVETETFDLGAVLVAEGYAAAWYPTSAPEPTRFAEYQQLQDTAQHDSLGSWETCDTMGR